MSRRVYCGLFIIFCGIGTLGAAATHADVLLYDVDFGTPPHTVGQPPATGGGAIPRKTITRVHFGEPLVVSTLGALTDQPCAFGDYPATMYDQMSFCMQQGGTCGLPAAYPCYHVEMDVLVEQLTSYGQFKIYVDCPTAHNVEFNGSNQVKLNVLGTGGYSQVIGSYTPGTPLFLEIDMDIDGDKWMISIDRTPLFLGDYPSSELRTVRPSMRTNLIPDPVAIDNVRILGLSSFPWKVGDLNCDGAVNFDDIDPFVLALGGEPGYLAQYPNCRWLNADCNGDGTVNFDDIDPFVALLGG